MSQSRDEKILRSDQFCQWQRIGIAVAGTDEGERYFSWTDAGKRFASSYERALAERIVTGEPIESFEDTTRLSSFDKDGYALVDEE